MTVRSNAAVQVTRTHAYREAFRVEREDGQPLRACAEAALRQYLSELDGHGVTDLYHLVISEVEHPLLKTVLEHAGGNQSRAAEILGINRSTLRKKLRQHGLDR
jgi:Fis family transcriptional regulator, factor for inversion stimulation protein